MTELSPRGAGRYAEDGRWWWDEGRRRWFATTDQEDVLEIEVEDIGDRSWVRRILATLSSQYGTLYWRFVGRVRGAGTQQPASEVVSETFPVLPAGLPLDNLELQGAFVSDIKARFRELQDRLLDEGWRLTGEGTHWWSAVYHRPRLDWDTPEHAYEASHQ